MAGLKAGLKALGLEEGRDVTFDIRFTRGKLEEAPTLPRPWSRQGRISWSRGQIIPHAP